MAREQLCDNPLSVEMRVKEGIELHGGRPPNEGHSWHICGTAVRPGWMKYPEQGEGHAEQGRKDPCRAGLAESSKFSDFLLNAIRSGGFESRDCYDKLFVLSFVL